EQMDSREVGRKVDRPAQLRKRDGHRLQAREERALEPQGRQGDEQGDVAEPEEIHWTVRAPIERHQHGQERRVEQLDPQRNPARQCWVWGSATSLSRGAAYRRPGARAGAGGAVGNGKSLFQTSSTMSRRPFCCAQRTMYLPESTAGVPGGSLAPAA